jgi:hypothetical protein
VIGAHSPAIAQLLQVGLDGSVERASPFHLLPQLGHELPHLLREWLVVVLGPIVFMLTPPLPARLRSIRLHA